MKFPLYVSALALTLGAAPAFSETEIAITMTAFDNPFLTILLNGMKAEAGKHPDVSLSIEDAQLDVGRQLNQVENFIASGVDAIVVNPVDGSSTPAMTKAAVEAGIPLVYVNHPPSDVNALPPGVSFVGSNEIDSGTMQTEAVCEMLGGTGRIFVMMGPLENDSAIVRTEDIHEVLSRPECAGIEIIDEQVANWKRIEAQDLMTNWLTAGEPFDGVIANNDEMAIGAIQAMKAVGVDMDDVVVAGIDATPDGLAAMQGGDLDVTVFQNATRQGEVTIEAALDMAGGAERDRTIWVPFEAVSLDNLEHYK